MPILPGDQTTNPTIQDIANILKANPEFYNVLGGVAGYSQQPMLTIANEVLSRILAENMPWYWNRQTVPPFITVSLQQDYCTSITDIGWLEDAWRIDINNSTSNNNGAPKPIFSMETVRQLPQTSIQNVPFQINFIPNYQAFMGLWQANTAYACGYGVSMTPTSPIQQFEDANGNILYIDSSNLGLNIESPGYTGTTIIPPGSYPYGTSGNTQPSAPPDATPGTLVQDGTVVWTVANPEAYAMRVYPVPARNGLCWYIVCRYQTAPQRLTKLSDRISQIPYSMQYLFLAGCRSQLKMFNGAKDAGASYAEWEEQLVKALRANDRQQDDNCLVPSGGLMGNNSPWVSPQGIGAAYPFAPGNWSGY